MFEKLGIDVNGEIMFSQYMLAMRMDALNGRELYYQGGKEAEKAKQRKAQHAARRQNTKVVRTIKRRKKHEPQMIDELFGMFAVSVLC